MAKFCFIALLVFAVMSCTNTKNMTIGLHVEGPAKDVKSFLVTVDSTYEVTLDSTGSATVVLAETAKPGYGSFSYGRVRIPLYVEPGKAFDLALKMEGKKAMPEFTGEGAKKNEYLNSPVLRNFRTDYILDEAAFIASMQENLTNLYANLDTLGFDGPFVELEKQRLNYSTNAALQAYPIYHKYHGKLDDYEASQVYYDAVKAMIKENEALMQTEEYKDAIAAFVQIYSLRDMKDFDPLVAVKTSVDYVDKNITSPVIASYLIDKYITEYVGRYGVENLSELTPVYDAKVTEPERKAKFSELCDKWSKIAKGQPSPSFKYLDIDGKEVSLEDLAGKYVYIDVWATWCGPCRGEIPALKELEHKLKDKNITFVSISCDQDKSAWETVVKDEKLGGVQLHKGEDQSFMEAFMIRGIPKFILLDKEGKIIESNMSRPSNAKTLETLNALEGI